MKRLTPLAPSYESHDHLTLASHKKIQLLSERRPKTTYIPRPLTINFVRVHPVLVHVREGWEIPIIPLRVGNDSALAPVIVEQAHVTRVHGAVLPMHGFNVVLHR